MRPTVQFDCRMSLRAVVSVLPTTFGTRHRGGVGGGPAPTVNAPRNDAAWGSETNRYVPDANVRVQIGWTISSTGVQRFTPGPERWKLCVVEKSCTCMS